jgi:nitrate/nitrite transporter NarK
LFCPQNIFFVLQNTGIAHILCVVFSNTNNVACAAIWRQIYAQAEEHKEDIYAGNHCVSVTKSQAFAHS